MNLDQFQHNRTRRALTCLSALAIVLISSCARTGKGSEQGDPSVGNDRATLKIMSFNIHHGAPASDDTTDLNLAAEVIKAQNVDLVALQEIDKNNERSGVETDQAKELAELTGMHYFFSKSIDYKGGGYGVAILSKFPIVSSQRFPLPYPAGKGEPRSAALIKVQLNDSLQLSFLSTHLDLVKENRLAQMHELNKISQSISGPLIIAGDLNATQESEGLAILKEGYVLDCGGNCEPTHPFDHPEKCIDFILMDSVANTQFKVVSYGPLNGINASDHLPLVAEMEY